jgi:hypothetical protein
MLRDDVDKKKFYKEREKEIDASTIHENEREGGREECMCGEDSFCISRYVFCV